jgi:general nucleoside transport system permease protein
MSRAVGGLALVKGLRVEPRPHVLHVAWYRLGGACLGLVMTLLVASLYQSSPGAFYSTLWSGTFGSVYGVQNVLSIAAPLILTGLAASIPYRIGLWNIGGDGQMYMGAWVAALIAFTWPHGGGFVLIPIMLVGAAIGGAAWMLLPALARALLGVNEIITTLMLNFVGLAWLTYWASGPWVQPNIAGGVLSKFIPTQSQLSPVQFGSVTVQWGFLLAVGVGVFAWVGLRYTRIAYELSILRASERSGLFAGIPARRRMIEVLLLGGALAGVAGAVEMMGSVYQYSPALSNNTGYFGVAVAILAAGSELAVILMGITFAGIIVASGVLTTLDVSAGASFFLFGLVLLFAAVGDSVARFRITTDRRHVVPNELATPVAAVAGPAVAQGVSTDDE